MWEKTVKYKNIKGMNLTWQVLEGILKHTNCNGCWDINRFINKENNNKEDLQKFLKYNFSVTLEGQIVAIADEIAQRQHDVDDGLRDKDLKLNFKDVAEHLIKEFQEIIEGDDKKDGDDIFIKNLKHLKKSIENLVEIKSEREQLYKVNTLVRNLIDYFIKDVTLNSLKELRNLRQNNIVIEENSKKYLKKRFIYFSPVGKQVNNIIEEFIKTKILNSYNVNRFDGKAIYIIKQLFKAYYTNPRQMPEYILQRLLKKIDEITSNIYNLKFSDGSEVKDIDLLNSKPEEIDKLIKLMKLQIKLEELDIPSKLKNLYSNQCQLNKKFKEVNTKNLEELDDNERIIKALIEISYVYISTICDYIAGMTDNYAKNEFKKLYLVD